MDKRGESESAPRAAAFQDLFEEAPVGYLLLDGDGRIRLVNRRMTAVFERPAAELIGRHLSDFSPDTPLERVKALANASQRSAGDARPPDDLQIRLPNGRLRWVRVTIDPASDPAARLTSTRMLVADISAEMASAAGLRRAGIRFRIAFENAPVGMHLSTPEGRFLEVNRALCRMFGFSEAQLLTMQVWDLVHPDDLGAFAPARSVLFAGESVRVDSRFVTADGSVRWCRLEAILPNGPEGYLVSQVTDISDLIETREHLADVVKAKDSFVAAVSHELRTPLAGVLGFASELRDGADRFTRAEVAEFAGLIAQGCTAADSLVEDLLVAARLEGGDIGLVPERTDLRDRALSTVAGSGTVPWPKSKAITVDGQPCVAWADPSRVDQILRNLVSNAARYGGSRTTILTGVSAEPREAFLRVVDDGPGVTGGLVDRLFQSFQHGAQEPGRTESVGLGLYISRVLARLMGGDLTYRRQGGTTVFELTLPLPDQATTRDT